MLLDTCTNPNFQEVIRVFYGPIIDFTNPRTISRTFYSGNYRIDAISLQSLSAPSVIFQQFAITKTNNCNLLISAYRSSLNY